MPNVLPSLREIKGVDFADISVEVDSSLERWSVKVADMVEASGVPLRGPTSDPTKHCQSFNPPGSEVGPTNAPVTWGKGLGARWKAFHNAFDVNIPAGQSSKHIPFDWSGPDAPWWEMFLFLRGLRYPRLGRACRPSAGRLPS